MKTRKSGAYAALAAVLLISAVLITNCVDPINPGGLFVPKDKDQPAAFVPPPGMGYVMLKFGSAGRTIRPLSGYVANVNAFAKFDVRISVVDGEAGTAVPTESFVADVPNSLSALQVLEDEAFTADPGTYYFEVWAYATAGAAQYAGAVAFGVSDDFTISAGGGSNQEIALGVIADAESGGKGTFTWALASNPSITKVELTITEYSSGDPVEDYEDEDITANLTGSTATATLDPGYYRVSLACTGTNVKSAKITEILHVYQGMTSHYAGTLPTLNPNVYTITYQYNDTTNIPSAHANGTEPNLVHGTAIAGPTTNPATTDFYPGYIWQGWFTTDVALGTAAAGGNLAAIGSYRPLKTQTLYGRWLHEGLHVTITWSTPGDASFDPVITLTDVTASDPDEHFLINHTSYTLNRLSPPTIRFAVASPTTGSYSNHEWSVSTADNVTANTATFDINFAELANIQLLIAGDLKIMVNATHSSNTTVPLSGDVELTIGNN